jgi:NAD(P)H-dependent flavin oxidoreductase YrpB (nitropropane dioxygenase family)
MIHTRICEMFGCKHPIVQTGMGWVSGARLTSATSAAGGFGILAAATMTFDELAAAITEVKSRTEAPFGVNLRTDREDALDRIDLIVREGVRLASFAGAPRRELVDRCTEAGVLTMPTIGAERHAVKMQGWGVSAVIAQGHEGGGHTGPIPTSILLPSVCRAVDIPVLGAGGFKDGRGLAAALAYGADGIAMGTRFLMTKESTVPEVTKQKYLDAGAKDTVVTTAVDGHPQRVIRTAVIEALERAGALTRFPKAAMNALKFRSLTGTPMGDLMREGLAMRKSQDLTWAQLAMAANAPMMTKASMVDGRPEVGILPTGQVAGTIDTMPTVAELLEEIVTEARAVLDGLQDIPKSGAEGRAA